MLQCNFQTGFFFVAVMVLVGNKTDLTEQRTITEQEGSQLAERSVPLVTSCPAANSRLSHLVTTSSGCLTQCK